MLLLDFDHVSTFCPFILIILNTAYVEETTNLYIYIYTQKYIYRVSYLSRNRKRVKILTIRSRNFEKRREKRIWEI